MNQIFDARVRPPFGSFANVTMTAAPQTGHYDDRAVSMPGSIQNGPDYRLFLEEIESAGITRALVAGRTGPAMGPTPANADVLALIDKDPQFYCGALAVGTDDTDAALVDLQKSLRQGIVAVMVEPGLGEVPRYVDDPHLDPIWEVCRDRDLPALLLSGGVCGPDLSYSDPVALDRLAGRWPDVNFVAIKGGNPYVMQILGVAFRRPNVWISPDLYMCNMPGANHYVEAANTFMADRLLYASAYPLVEVGEALAIWSRYDFHPKIRSRIFHENAARLFEG